MKESIDILVIGSGPAGIQAAIHSSIKKASTLVVGKPMNSALYSVYINNLFGIKGVTGSDLIFSGITQAKSLGSSFIEENVVSSHPEDNKFVFVLDGGMTITAKAAIIATGISRIKLGIPGENELYGKGVSYCALCDCNFYKGRRVIIIGNDSEAAVSANIMTSYALETSWIIWKPGINNILIEKAQAAGVTIYNSEPHSINGKDKVESVTLKDGTIIKSDGVFIELGAKSAADIAMSLNIMPKIDGTINVDRHYMTGVTGIFACGDVTGKPWQVAKAIGEGCLAGIYASDYVNRLQ